MAYFVLFRRHAVWSKFIKWMELLVSCDLFFKVPTCTYTANKEGSISLTTNNGGH